MSFLKISRIKLKKKIPVYDLEVDSDNHNFCLSNGVVAHNSKDVSDTIAGTVFKMVELGPEEVLSPPEERIQSEMVDVYSQLTENMRNRISKLSAISNAESYFRM